MIHPCLNVQRQTPLPTCSIQSATNLTIIMLNDSLPWSPRTTWALAILALTAVATVRLLLLSDLTQFAQPGSTRPAPVPVTVEFMMSKTANYTGLCEKVRELSLQPLTAGQLLQETSSSMACVFPPSAVMLTYSSHYTLPLIALQHAAMDAFNLRDCLESHFITACLDQQCMQFCDQHGIPHCVLVDFGGILPSDFGQGEYRFLTYIKHELMAAALEHAEHVFFFDADVAIFKNPWIETQFGRGLDGKHMQVDGGYDLMYQREWGAGLDCSGAVNSGQLYLRNSAKVHTYLANMQAHKAIILNGSRGLDQDFVWGAAMAAGLKVCSLPPTLYTAHCHPGEIFGHMRHIDHGLAIQHVVTYHTNCCSGTECKLWWMNKMVTAVKQHDASALVDVLRKI